MKIENELKLDFSDVLIRPKRSTLSSRSEVNLERTFTFKHPTPKQTWTGIPIICSNMDTIATIDMYKELSKHKIITCFHKKIDIEDITENCDPNYFMLSTGIKDYDYDLLLNNIYKLNLKNINVKFICIDVANGYMFSLIDFCKRIRQRYPDKIIVAGNVVTRENC